MILTNYRNILSEYSYAYGKQSASTRLQTPFPVVSIDGTSNDGWAAQNQPGVTYFSNLLTGCSGIDATYPLRVVAGTGSTETTADMHSLESPLLTSDALSQTQLAYSEGLVFNTIIRNTTGEEQVISELGLTVTYTFYTSATAGSTKSVLVAREVLSEPITLAAGEAAAVSVKLSWR